MVKVILAASILVLSSTINIEKASFSEAEAFRPDSMKGCVVKGCKGGKPSKKNTMRSFRR